VRWCEGGRGQERRTGLRNGSPGSLLAGFAPRRPSFSPECSRRRSRSLTPRAQAPVAAFVIRSPVELEQVRNKGMGSVDDVGFSDSVQYRERTRPGKSVIFPRRKGLRKSKIN
jgi:hypothetical protein